MTRTPDFSSDFLIQQAEIIVRSYERIVGQSLFKILGFAQDACGSSLSEALFFAPLAVLSHDVIGTSLPDKDNRYNYANHKALSLFERSYDEQTQMASTHSAGLNQEEQCLRNDLLAECLCKGMVRFSTTRRSESGKTVALENATLFNLTTVKGVYAGQAVIF